MGNCSCCEEDPPPTVTTYPHQNSNPAPFNHHFPTPVPDYPTAPPPPVYEQPPVVTMYPPLPSCAPYLPAPVPAEPSYFWAASSFGGVPPMAIKAGTDKSGEPIYIGRSLHNGDNLPAKIVVSHQCAYVSWSGTEIRKEQYDVLCAESYAWHSGAHGEVPDNAVSGGLTSDGETLFFGRVCHDGTVTPGKIHPSHGCLYIPYDGKELAFQEYEVLVIH